MENQRRRQDDHRQQSTGWTHAKVFIENVRDFLANFKTQACNIQYEHNFSTCNMQHCFDLRRNPYLEHSFAYYPSLQLLHEAHQGRRLSLNSPLPQLPHTMLCLNESQLLYHPICYKINPCLNPYCNLGLICPNLHQNEQKLFQYGEFFRFDINTHKTKPCPRREYHERKTCIYFHNECDQRRANFALYSHELCAKKCNERLCGYSHNKIEQVYHPSRYKSKFCKSYTNKNSKCDYKQFCAFAHTQSQIKIQMIHLLDKDYDFYLQKYKTVWCPDTQSHDRSGCVYAHNMQDFRRNPFKFNYDSEKCPFWNFEEQLKSLEDSGCKAGMDCDKCHGWMQQRYHPQLFKKPKPAELKDANLIIQKKIINTPKQAPVTTKEKSRISKVVDEKMSEISRSSHNNGFRDLGAPFFKKQGNSESSKKTAPRTTKNGSDESGRDENEQRQGQFLSTQNCVPARKNSMFLHSQDEIWRNNNKHENENWIQMKIQEGRARSQHKFDDRDTVYSHSLKEAVGDNSILKKLNNNNINGLRLKNLSQTEIEEFMFLSKQQKNELNKRIKVYQLRRQRNPIIYSFELAKFFIKRKKEELIEKTKKKNIKEEKLLSMKQKQFTKLEFLTEYQQEELLSILSQYKKIMNEEEFSQISQEITRFVSPKRTPNT